MFIRGALAHRASANAIFKLCSWKGDSRINVKAIPLVWMNQATAHATEGLLRQGSQGIAFGPNYIDGLQSTESVRLPDIRFHVFRKARVSATSSSVVLHERQVIIDRAIGPDQDKYNYAAGHIIAHSGDAAIVRLGKSKDIEKGLFLGGNGSFNYYHWVVEILAKLEFLPKLPERYRKYPLLVSEDAVRIPSFKESLCLFAKGYELIVLDKHSSYMVDELIYVDSPNNLPFNLFCNQKFKPAYVSIDSRSIDYLRKTALHAAEDTSAPSNYPKKIFLCRKSGLRNYNQDEVVNCLSALGFTNVFMEDLSFLDQIRTCHRADLIVGPTGAAWTNLIFCRPETRALCWMAEELGDFSAYSSIAGVVGVDLRFLTYKAGVRSTGELYCKDYNIDLKMIEKGLSALT